MENDIIYNLEQARIWSTLLGKDERALEYYDAHLAIAESLAK